MISIRNPGFTIRNPGFTMEVMQEVNSPQAIMHVYSVPCTMWRACVFVHVPVKVSVEAE